MLRPKAWICQAPPLLLVVAAILGAACAHRGEPAGGRGGDPEEQLGTIRRVGSFGFAIVPDRDTGTRYTPDRLPADFAVDGLRVIFSGSQTPPPEGARLWGTPFHLVTIRRADRPR